MGAHILNDYIVVNCSSTEVDEKNECVHFLTHVGRHQNNLKHVVSSHVHKIYTSEFNVWYLKTFLEADTSQFISVPLWTRRKVKAKDKYFTFEFLNANHCPGAVMILFKGDFGCYLYTGNCRYSPSMLDYSSLKPFSHGNKVLDKLYVNAAYLSLQHNFPKREVVIQQILEFIREHKEERIYICARLLGKEDILFRLALESNEKICVNQDKLKVLNKLGYKSSLFTTEVREARLRVVGPSEITSHKMKKRRFTEKCLAIVFSACNNSENKMKANGIHIFPASDHSSASETKLMIKSFKAKDVYLLNQDSTLADQIKAQRTTASDHMNSNALESPLILNKFNDFSNKFVKRKKLSLKLNSINDENRPPVSVKQTENRICTRSQNILKDSKVSKNIILGDKNTQIGSKKLLITSVNSSGGDSDKSSAIFPKLTDSDSCNDSNSFLNDENARTGFNSGSSDPSSHSRGDLSPSYPPSISSVVINDFNDSISTVEYYRKGGSFSYSHGSSDDGSNENAPIADGRVASDDESVVENGILNEEEAIPDENVASKNRFNDDLNKNHKDSEVVSKHCSEHEEGNVKITSEKKKNGEQRKVSSINNEDSSEKDNWRVVANQNCEKTDSQEYSSQEQIPSSEYLSPSSTQSVINPQRTPGKNSHSKSTLSNSKKLRNKKNKLGKQNSKEISEELSASVFNTLSPSFPPSVSDFTKSSDKFSCSRAGSKNTLRQIDKENIDTSGRQTPLSSSCEHSISPLHTLSPSFPPSVSNIISKSSTRPSTNINSSESSTEPDQNKKLRDKSSIDNSQMIIDKSLTTLTAKKKMSNSLFRPSYSKPYERTNRQSFYRILHSNNSDTDDSLPSNAKVAHRLEAISEISNDSDQNQPQQELIYQDHNIDQQGCVTMNFTSILTRKSDHLDIDSCAPIKSGDNQNSASNLPSSRESLLRISAPQNLISDVQISETETDSGGLLFEPPVVSHSDGTSEENVLCGDGENACVPNKTGKPLNHKTLNQTLFVSDLKTNRIDSSLFTIDQYHSNLSLTLSESVSSKHLQDSTNPTKSFRAENKLSTISEMTEDTLSTSSKKSIETNITSNENGKEKSSTLNSLFVPDKTLKKQNLSFLDDSIELTLCTNIAKVKPWSVYCRDNSKDNTSDCCDKRESEAGSQKSNSDESTILFETHTIECEVHKKPRKKSLNAVGTISIERNLHDQSTILHTNTGNSKNNYEQQDSSEVQKRKSSTNVSNQGYSTISDKTTLFYNPSDNNLESNNLTKNGSDSSKVFIDDSSKMDYNLNNKICKSNIKIVESSSLDIISTDDAYQSAKVLANDSSNMRTMSVNESAKSGKVVNETSIHSCKDSVTEISECKTTVDESKKGLMSVTESSKFKTSVNKSYKDSVTELGNCKTSVTCSNKDLFSVYGSSNSKSYNKEDYALVSVIEISAGKTSVSKSNTSKASDNECCSGKTSANKSSTSKASDNETCSGKTSVSESSTTDQTSENQSGESSVKTRSSRRTRKKKLATHMGYTKCRILPIIHRPSRRSNPESTLSKSQPVSSKNVDDASLKKSNTQDPLTSHDLFTSDVPCLNKSTKPFKQPNKMSGVDIFSSEFSNNESNLKVISKNGSRDMFSRSSETHQSGNLDKSRNDKSNLFIASPDLSENKVNGTLFKSSPMVSKSQPVEVLSPSVRPTSSLTQSSGVPVNKSKKKYFSASLSLGNF